MTNGRSALVIRSEHLDFLERALHERVGVLHARVATIHEVIRRDDALWVTVDDERGPLLADASASLTVATERERWTIAQIIAVAEACMKLRAAGILPSLGGDQLFIDIAGRARMHAPIPTPPIDPRSSTRTGPMPNAMRMATMSPEGAMARQPLTPASDVFSLATLLFHALTGDLPFVDESPMGMLVKIIQAPAPALPTEIPGLADVVARALEKTAATRYSDAGTFATALRRCAPDVAEYDEVISDRIVAWRATAAGRGQS